MEALRARILEKYPKRTRVPRSSRVSDLARTAREEAALTSDARREEIIREVRGELLEFQAKSLARIVYGEQAGHPWRPLAHLKVTVDAFLHWFKEKATIEDFRKVGTTFVKWYKVEPVEALVQGSSASEKTLPDFRTWYEEEGQNIEDSTLAAESWVRWAASKKFPQNTDWKEASSFLNWLFESASAAYQAKLALGLVRRRSELWEKRASSRSAGAAAAAAAALAQPAPSASVTGQGPSGSAATPSQTSSSKSRFDPLSKGTYRGGMPVPPPVAGPAAPAPHPAGSLPAQSPRFARGTAASGAKTGRASSPVRPAGASGPPPFRGSLPRTGGVVPLHLGSREPTPVQRVGRPESVREEEDPVLTGGGGGGGEEGVTPAQRLLALAAAARRGKTRAGGSGTFVAGPSFEEEEE